MTPGTSLSTDPLPLKLLKAGVWLTLSGGDCWSDGLGSGAAVGTCALAESIVKNKNKIGWSAFPLIIPFLLRYRNLDARHVFGRFIVSASDLQLTTRVRPCAWRGAVH